MNSPRFAYPVALDLTAVPVLVLGGGRIGARKVAGLAAAGAAVRLVAIDVTAHLDPSHVVEIRQRPFEPADLDGVRLVVTATGDAHTDRSVANEARDRGIWTNAADQPDDCGFVLPAIARRGRVTVSVSTDGASPALASYLRDRFAELLTDEVADLAEMLAARRAEIHAAGGSTEDVEWRDGIARRLDPAFGR